MPLRAGNPTPAPSPELSCPTCSQGLPPCSCPSHYTLICQPRYYCCPHPHPCIPRSTSSHYQPSHDCRHGLSPSRLPHQGKFIQGPFSSWAELSCEVWGAPLRAGQATGWRQRPEEAPALAVEAAEPGPREGGAGFPSSWKSEPWGAVLGRHCILLDLSPESLDHLLTAAPHPTQGLRDPQVDQPLPVLLWPDPGSAPGGVHLSCVFCHPCGTPSLPPHHQQSSQTQAGVPWATGHSLKALE